MLIQIHNNPQLLADDTKITGLAEYHPPEIFKKDGFFHIRHFSLSEGYNTQGWRVRDLERYVRTGLNKPTIITPGFHHIVGLDREQLLHDMEPFTIGYAVDFVRNNNYNCYDCITKVTDPDAERALEAGYIPPFMSPLVHASKWHWENIDGENVKIFDEWELMQHAVVKKPGFRPVEMARIRDVGCKGTTGVCASKLAGIAEDLSKYDLLKNYFDTYIDESGKNLVMPEGEKDNTMQSLLKKLQDDLIAKEKELNLKSEQFSVLESKAKKDSETLVSIQAERDTLKKEVDTFKTEKEIQEKRKSFDEKLRKSKMFWNDSEARSKKIDELISKKIELGDLDSIYEGMFYTDEQLKELTASNPLPPTQPNPQTGIAADISTTIPTNDTNKRHAEGALVLKRIMEL